MRKRLSLFLAVVLLLSLMLSICPTTLAASDFSMVRVLLSTGSTNSMTIPVSGSYFIEENGATFKNGTLTAKISGSDIVLTHSSEGKLYTGKTINIMREKVDPSAGYLRITTTHGLRSYLGHLTLRRNGSIIQAVNNVPLAHYLYGVVAYEMSDSFPLEALKAQAVAAKCYVLANISPTSNYDIGDTSSDQVYKGYNSSYKNVIKAVDATWNVGLYLGNTILCSYFAASNGGYTLKPSEVWSGTNRYTWDKAYDNVVDKYDLKNPLSKTGTATFPKAGSDSMNANMANYLFTRSAEGLTSAGYGGASLLSIDSINNVSEYSSSKALFDMDISLQTSEGVQQTNLQLVLGFSDIATYTMGGVSGLRLYEISESNKGFTIEARRYGHGVGLSQRGAEQMANEGWKYEKILDFYYPGASLKTMNVSEPSDPVNKHASSGGSEAITNAIATAVVKDTVNLRQGPGTGYDKLGSLPAGVALNVYAQTDTSAAGWSLVVYNGVQGYIRNDYLTITPITEQQPQEQLPPQTGGTSSEGYPVVAYGEVTSNTLNMRKSAVNGTVLQQLKKGDTIDIYGYVNNSTWYFCSAKGKEGYVSAQYVKLTGAPESTPSDSPSYTEPNNDMAPAGSQMVTLHDQVLWYQNAKIDSRKVLGRFQENQALTVSGSTGDFYIFTLNGTTGYIYKEDLMLLSAGDGSTSNGSSSGSSILGYGKTSGKVNFRKGPGTGYKSMGMLAKGTELTLYSKDSGWYHVLANGTEGYISADYVTETSGNTGSAGNTDNAGNTGNTGSAILGYGQTTGNVNFRKGPGTGYSSMGKLAKGTELTIYAKESNGWYHVSANGKDGYISGDYVKVTSNAGSSAAAPSPAHSTGESNAWSGRVVNEWVRLRSSADYNSQSNILGDYDVGTQLIITASSGDWYLVQTPDGKTGFMHKDYVEVTGTISTRSGKTTGNVNFRKNASESAAIIKTLAKGTKVIILGESGDWYHIQVGNQVGYAVKRYIAE